MKFGKQQAIQFINKRGILLVYPPKGKKEPDSLWNQFFPRSQMDWAWDSEADERVNDLWILMKELSVSRKVVYSKWFQNRGTFFSKKVFVSLLFQLRKQGPLQDSLSVEAKDVYRALCENSPLSTKELKSVCGLKGSFFKSTYERALRQLYSRGLIVSFGEKEDGVFPSACMGATSLIFESLWRRSLEPQDSNQKDLTKILEDQPSLKKHFLKTARDIQGLNKR